MQATCIVRRIDDLGRLVVPREIRRKLKLCEGDAVEMFIDGKNLVLTKHSPGEPILQSAMSLRDDVFEADWLDDQAQLLELIDATIKVLRKECGE